MLTITVLTVCYSHDVPSQRIDETKLSHLEADQRQQLLQLLDEYDERFSGLSGLYEAAVHRI